MSGSTNLPCGTRSNGSNASTDYIFDSDNIRDNKFKHLNYSTDLKNSNVANSESIDKFKHSNSSTNSARNRDDAANAAILSIERLSISRGGKVLYRDFSLDIAAGSVTCLIAPSGAGKTTLLDYIAGTLEDADTSGRVLFSGTEVRPALSFLFQEPRLISTASVLENVMLPLVNLMPKSKAEARARDFIARAGLSEKCESLPEALSGGERRRVSMARSFAFPSALMLLDEPFQSQDLKIKLRLMDTLASLLALERRTALFVTHDAKEAVSLADRIVVMDGSPLEIIFDKDNVTRGDETLESKITSLVVHSRF